jgi:hypothetical protein
MKKFFSRNLDSRGRWVRGAGGALFVIGGGFACSYHVWVAVVLMLGGGFMLFEAVRGWCVVRACGIRTKM